MVIAGGVLGFVLSWVWIAVVLFGGFASAYSAQDSDGFLNSWGFGAIVVAAALAPLVLAVVLLVRPGTRQAGAGLVMGLAIGMVVGSGICASALVPNF